MHTPIHPCTDLHAPAQNCTEIGYNYKRIKYKIKLLTNGSHTLTSIKNIQKNSKFLFIKNRKFQTLNFSDDAKTLAFCAIFPLDKFGDAPKMRDAQTATEC